MDSYINYRLFCPEYQPVFVHTGSRYSQRDFHVARDLSYDLISYNGPPLREYASGFVPHRNIILLATVANVFQATHICVSAPRGELAWDQQPAFHRQAEKLLPGVTIVNPLAKLTKAQAVRMYLSSDAEYSREELLSTRSCYASDTTRCGRCAACVKRWVAMANNGIHEGYDNNVRAYARSLANEAKLREVWRYGLRPVWEAYSAFRYGP